MIYGCIKHQTEIKPEKFEYANLMVKEKHGKLKNSPKLKIGNAYEPNVTGKRLEVLLQVMFLKGQTGRNNLAPIPKDHIQLRLHACLLHCFIFQPKFVFFYTN